MSGSILERLQARLAAKPAVVSVGTLFADLEDAHAEIEALTAQIERLTNADDQNSPKIMRPGISLSNAMAPSSASVVAPHIAPEVVAHAHQLLVDAEERMSVNALGTVSDFIGRAKRLLAG